MHLLPSTSFYYSALDGDGNGGASLDHVTAILTQGSPVPEPSTYALALLGGLGLLGGVACQRRVARLRV